MQSYQPALLWNHPPNQTLHMNHHLTNGVSLHNTSGDTTHPLATNGVGSPHNSGKPLTTCACTKGSHTCPLPILPVELLALTANGLTCICSRSPGSSPLPAPTIYRSLQVQGTNETISPHCRCPTHWAMALLPNTCPSLHVESTLDPGTNGASSHDY